MKKPKTPKVKLPKLTKHWRLFRAALREFRAHWKRYVLILAVVAVPSDLLGLIPSLATDALTSAYISFAAIVMNVALIWAVVRRDQDGSVPGLGSAYYDGSVALVRFVLVSLALVVFLIPAALGAALYAIGLLASGATGIYGPEQLLIGLVALVIAAPSFFLLVRFGFASYAVVADDLRPVAALRYSWRLTRRRFWASTGRFMMLGVYLVLVSLPATLLTIILSLVRLGGLSTVVFEIATTLVALPVANIYLIKLYRNLEDTLPAAAESAPAETP